MLKLFVVAADGPNPQVGSAVLTIAGNPTRFWAQVGRVLQDGGARNATWHSRGDGASRLRLLCSHIFTSSSLTAEQDGTRRLRNNVIKWDGIAPSTNDTVRRAARILASQHAALSTSTFPRARTNPR
ncbi:hypothetical protein N9L68_02240 [bacterium]|nr:hypothetical protein [bacterium]